jgi:dipeptidyl aminopeptidase/acylaminoacyl peptidase
MKTIPLTAAALGALVLAGCTSVAPAAPETPAAPAELAFISPQAEAVRVGYAGEDPADIARYLLASGARGALLSPDGETLAIRWSITGAPQIWTLPAAGGQPQQRTFGNGVTFFAWAPNGKTLVYGADNDGNEQESYYALNLDEMTERLVMPAVAGGFRRFGGFTQDGGQIAYASTERNGLDFDIYMADFATGESRRVYEGKHGFFVEAVSPDGGTLLVSQTVGEDADNLYLIDAASGERTTVTAPEPRANHTDGGVAWSADGKSLYMASNVGSEHARLVRYDLAAGTFETVFAADADVENVHLCGAGDSYLVWTTNELGASRLHARSMIRGEMIETPELADGVYGLDCTEGSDRLAITIDGYDTPGDVMVWDLAAGTLARAFESNLAGLDKSRLVKPQSITMAARDGVMLQGLLYLPDAGSVTGGGLPPVVFDVHGGPTGQSRPTFDGSAQYLVDRGIAVFQPNVRGSTGFGRTYTTLDDKEKRLDSVRDLVDMLAALKADGRVDADRAAVLGGSYGGYAVNAVLAEYPGTFKAGVALFGVADWVTALEVASPALKASDIIEYGDINDPEWRAFYEVNSPIRNADKIRVPVLYSHGAMDPRIDIAETETMVRALRANGVEAPFIRIPDEGHGWRKLSNRLFYFRRQAEFLEAQLAKPGTAP